ncbi:MAG: tetraacyldisaccharide 4'-kinase [Lysobacteraceae bacterium]|nr:MAG: tetraacyldisaccharide 4'-kinase [Xanthomonadaceae bacterium]
MAPDALRAWLEARWYGGAPVPAWLAGLARVYGLLARWQRWTYRCGIRTVAELPVPVLVVGNLTVGGAGKTPLVIALVRALAARGWRPGVISRGYGRRGAGALRVAAGHDATEVGDEPWLIFRRCGCPVAVARRRAEAGRLLIASGEVDLLIADDGLQHHALARTLEVLVVDGRRGFGNGRLLPAGPLREPVARAGSCDFLVCNGEGPGCPGGDAVPMRLRLGTPTRILDGTPVPWEQLGRVRAIAGIADPERFFQALRERGLEVDAHGFPDHHRYTADDFAFDDGTPLLMTEKDLGKCLRLARGHWLSVPAEAELPASFLDAVDAALRRHGARRPPARAQES